MVRLTGLPPASRRGVPSASNTVECPPIQVALALPLANRHLPGDHVAAVRDHGLGEPGGRPPGDDRIARAENFLRDLGIEKAGRLRTRQGLRQAPAGAGIGGGEGLDHLIGR